jgi:N-succinyldiaminopimelate aminotransferase
MTSSPAPDSTLRLAPALQLLQPYPFERLRALLAGNQRSTASGLRPIDLSIGEPKHATPALVLDALRNAVTEVSHYPTTAGAITLRETISKWIQRRHGLQHLDAATQVLPVLGSREALFAFAQVVVDRTVTGATVLMPNPFYQIYEGAALLAGAQPHYVNSVAANGFAPDWDAVPPATWARTQLVYVCSPDNPTGRVLRQDEWARLFELSDRHGFVIAADECYSEIYFDEARPPLGALAAAQALGRSGYPRLMTFGSLSKRSNAPGLRSGYVAGDANLIKAFLRYRTYHGSAMSPNVAAASVVAWNDEEHVRANRALYAQKFRQLHSKLDAVLPTHVPEAAFYFWSRVPGSDAEFARRLHEQHAVTVLPGSFFARDTAAGNPGAGFVRMALVAPLADCAEAVDRILEFASVTA